MPEADALARIPLLAGHAREDLEEMAGAMRRRTLSEGDVLWRQGEDARDLALIVDGGVAASLRVAGGQVEIWRGGPGEPVGELALLDGGAHSATVRATRATTLLLLGRADLDAMLARPHPSAFLLRRRLLALLAERLRRQLRTVAGSLGGAAPPPPPAGAAARALADLDYCSPPDSGYLRRMAAFHDFDPLAAWGFLTSGRYALCPPGRTLLPEGATPAACFLTVNGAVEKVIARDGRRIRIGLAGPGKALGYEGLIDGLPSPVTVATRERTLLLVIPAEPFGRLLGGEDGISRVVLDVVQRDLVATLRQALMPLARQVAAPA